MFIYLEVYPIRKYQPIECSHLVFRRPCARLSAAALPRHPVQRQQGPVGVPEGLPEAQPSFKVKVRVRLRGRVRVCVRNNPPLLSAHPPPMAKARIKAPPWGPKPRCK